MGGRWRADGRMMGRRERGEGILKTIPAFYEAKEKARNHEKEGNTYSGGFMECNFSGSTIHQSILNRSSFLRHA